jgi:hypothetical protein
VSAHPVEEVRNVGEIRYIDMVGDARRGYSGGPLFDNHGVVGIILTGEPQAPPMAYWKFEAIGISAVPK